MNYYLLINHLTHVVNKTWNFSGRLKNENDHFSNAAMGLAAEAGEAADVVKKMLYHSEKPFSFFREKIVLELGDVLYYMMKVMDLFGITWDEVVEGNRKKLESRHPELGKVTERFGPGAIK